MKKKPTISQADIDLFHAVMKGTVRIDSPAKPQANPIKTKPAPSRYTADFAPEETVEAEEALFFARGGLQHKLIRKLRQGKIPIDAKLDLHGLTVTSAYQALLDFINACQRQGIRSGLIVHGKGYRSQFKPVLKNYVNQWLREHFQVIAFCSARPKDGGNGALYVILKSSKADEEL